VLSDPTTTIADATSPTGYSRSPFSNNVIPASRLLNVSKEITQLGFPLPNNPGNRSFNFQQASTNPTSADQWSGRIDHKISDSDNLFARWTQDERYNITQGLMPDHGSITLYNAYNGVLGWNHMINPTLLNELRFGYLRAGTGSGGVIQQVVLGPGGQIADFPGLENVPAELRLGLQNFSINGLGNPGYGELRTYGPQNVY
jgi:hypothetical protein